MKQIMLNYLWLVTNNSFCYNFRWVDKLNNILRNKKPNENKKEKKVKPLLLSKKFCVYWRSTRCCRIISNRKIINNLLEAASL